MWWNHIKTTLPDPSPSIQFPVSASVMVSSGAVLTQISFSPVPRCLASVSQCGSPTGPGPTEGSSH